jgi:hypothetical protein
MDPEFVRIFSLFFDAAPIAVQTIDSSHGDSDFRTTFLVETDADVKVVLKLADNDFTFPEKIAVWQRTIGEYRKLGYDCPRILTDKSGGFPVVSYRGHRCTAYAEEFSAYRTAADRGSNSTDSALYETYKRDIWHMTAQIAAKHLDYTEYPSAYCLFETFCPSDQADEVLENALEWKEYADTLPDIFKEQTERIFRIWSENRAALEPVYRTLPTSVFQADLNPTNLLLDESGRFVGVCDFNLCGRDVFLNYLMRENYGEFEKELAMIRDALNIVSEDYRFSDAEKDAALMLYRCLKPLSFISLDTLKACGTDPQAIRAVLDETERYLTADLDFRSCMQ